GVEVHRVRRERRTCRVLDALVDRQNRDVTSAAQSAVIDHRLQAAEHGRRPIREAINSLDVVAARQMQRIPWNGLALVLQKTGGFTAEDFFDLRAYTLNGHDF